MAKCYLIEPGRGSGFAMLEMSGMFKMFEMSGGLDRQKSPTIQKS